METAIVWFREDLRLEDNAAWHAAVSSGRAVLPVYIDDTAEGGAGAGYGGAARWWLHHALADLQRRLRACGAELVFRRGVAYAELKALIAASGAVAVYWNRRYDPDGIAIDAACKRQLKEAGLEVSSHNSALLREPWQVATQAGNPYRVYTPYARSCAALADAEPLPAPGNVRPAPVAVAQVTLEDLGLLPRVPWDGGLADFWQVTRAAGLARLHDFVERSVPQYGANRDLPFTDGTSRLSPYLRWGMIGPREVAAILRPAMHTEGGKTFYRELIWREFAYHVLYHFPHTLTHPLQEKFAGFPWQEDAVALKAWQRGRTGYPLVDAGMRQLWQTGWMHNRVRMVVASFLVKHLLISWQEGAAWFMDTLVDADYASNTLGWQWAGGCGADAAPYFRIFNPITQSEKFDPEGEYIRRYVPELSKVSSARIHQPWQMSMGEQVRAGCRMGEDYPAPVIEHGAGRQRALAALATLK